MGTPDGSTASAVVIKAPLAREGDVQPGSSNGTTVSAPPVPDGLLAVEGTAGAASRPAAERRPGPTVARLVPAPDAVVALARAFRLTDAVTPASQHSLHTEAKNGSTERQDREDPAARLRRQRAQLDEEARTLETAEDIVACKFRELQAERAELRAEWDRLRQERQELVQLRNDNARLTVERDRAFKAVETNASQAIAQRHEFHELRADIDRQRQEIEHDKGLLIAARQQLAAQRERLEEQYTQYVRTRRQETERLSADRRLLKTALDEIAEARSQISAERAQFEAYQKAISVRRQEESDRLVQEWQRLEAARASIDDEEKRLDGERARIESEGAELARRQQQYNHISARLAAEQERVGAEYRALDTANQLLSAERERLAAQLRQIDADRAELDHARQEIDRRAADVAAERRRLTAAKNMLRTADDVLASEFAQLKSEQVVLEELSNQLNARDAELERQREEIKALAAETSSEHAALAADRKRLEAERSELTAQALALQQLEAELGAQQAAVTKERKRFEGSWAELATQRQEASERLAAERRLFEDSHRALELERERLAAERARLMAWPATVDSDDDADHEEADRNADLVRVPSPRSSDRAAEPQREADDVQPMEPKSFRRPDKRASAPIGGLAPVRQAVNDMRRSTGGGPKPVNGPRAKRVIARASVGPVRSSCPPSQPIKVKYSSGLYHLPGMAAYDRTQPDECFLDEKSAIAAGFKRARR